MNIPLYTIISRYATCAVLICTLSACNMLFPKPVHTVKHAKPAKTRYTANDYVKHVALARLDPEDNGNDVEIINAYAKQKAKESTRQSLLVLQYKNKGDAAMQQIAAPISLSPKGANFPELLDIMNQLIANRSTLHNLHIVITQITPNKALALPATGDKDVQDTVVAQEQTLLDSNEKLPMLDEVRTQLRLIQFFIDHRFRDAAYIAVDNAKQLVASLPHDKLEDANVAHRFSQELEHLESETRKSMPFTL